VRLCCESTMALIEDNRRQFYPICCKIEDLSSNKKITSENLSASIPSINFLLSEIALGWFEHCELKMPKFWWMGPMSSYFTFFWEFFKVLLILK
jgi:hypothetical protein